MLTVLPSALLGNGLKHLGGCAPALLRSLADVAGGQLIPRLGQQLAAGSAVFRGGHRISNRQRAPRPRGDISLTWTGSILIAESSTPARGHPLRNRGFLCAPPPVAQVDNAFCGARQLTLGRPESSEPSAQDDVRRVHVGVAGVSAVLALE